MFCLLSEALRRKRFKEFMVQLPPCLTGLEACGGSHCEVSGFQREDLFFSESGLGCFVFLAG